MGYVTTAEGRFQLGVNPLVLSRSDKVESWEGVDTLEMIDSCAGYLICQNFETPTTGYDNGETWTETAGDIVEAAYTTVHLTGNQSLRIRDATGTNQTVSPAYAAQSHVYGFMKIRLPTAAIGATTIPFLVTNGSSSNLGGMVHSATEGWRTFQGSINGTFQTALATGTTYYLWWEWVSETGAGNLDGIMRIWLATNGTKPGSPTDSVTTGDAGPLTSTNLRLQVTGGQATTDIIYDSVYVSTTAIGNVAW